MARKAAKAEKPKDAKPAKGGRPSSYTPILAERICTLIAQGKSKRQIEAMDGLPNRETIDAWLLKHEGFSSQYARACEIRTESFAEEIVDIADTEPDPSKARNRIDARKWVASKLLPKKYGDAMTLKGDKDNPLRFAKPIDIDENSLLAIAAGEAALDG